MAARSIIEAQPVNPPKKPNSLQPPSDQKKIFTIRIARRLNITWINIFIK